MKFSKDLIIYKTDTIKSAMIKIKRNGSRTIIVLDKKIKNKLLGTLSEGDIQRALINNADVLEKIGKFYNKNPKKIFIKNIKNIKLKKMFIDNQIGLTPVVDSKNKLKKIITWNDIFTYNEKFDLKDIDVVIMAGGKGKRMRPLTYNIPSLSKHSKKGGSFVLDMSHIGKKIGRDWLLYYDGLYNPNVEPYTYYSNDLLMDYDAYTMLRVRFNYWLTNKASVFFCLFYELYSQRVLAEI